MSRLVPMAILTVVTAGGHQVQPRPAARESLAHIERSGPPVATVQGVVEVSGRERGAPASLSPYARRRYRPPQAPGLAGGPEDAVVYFLPLDPSTSVAAPDTASVIQRDRTILPHVLAVRVGTTVEFPNQDEVFHNLFSLSSGNKFSLGRYGPGVTKSHEFVHPGTVRLFCDIHAEMAGVILVVDTPYVARPDPDGPYRMTGLPAGAYRVVAWHPTGGADTVTVSLRDGEERELNFSLRGGS